MLMIVKINYNMADRLTALDTAEKIFSLRIFSVNVTKFPVSYGFS